MSDLKFRLVHWGQRHFVNPVARRLGRLVMLETIGRRSGQPRLTPIGGRLRGNEFWLVSEHGTKSDYVRNIQSNPAVRVRIRDRWRNGTAELLPQDDPRSRLSKLGGLNSVGVRLMGTDMLTIRIDLED